PLRNRAWKLTSRSRPGRRNQRRSLQQQARVQQFRQHSRRGKISIRNRLQRASVLVPKGPTRRQLPCPPPRQLRRPKAARRNCVWQNVISKGKAVRAIPRKRGNGCG